MQLTVLNPGWRKSDPPPKSGRAPQIEKSLPACMLEAECHPSVRRPSAPRGPEVRPRTATLSPKDPLLTRVGPWRFDIYLYKKKSRGPAGSDPCVHPPPPATSNARTHAGVARPESEGLLSVATPEWTLEINSFQGKKIQKTILTFKYEKTNK